MVTTLWFCYSLRPDETLDSPEPIRSPYHLSWHMGRFLRSKAQERGWGFEYRNLNDTSPVTIGADDIVIGHPWFDGNTFIEQAFNHACRAKFVLQPYTERMVGAEAEPLLHQMWTQADHLFLNTGPFWFDTMDNSPYAQYKDKATRLDNQVNPALHPHSKRSWNEPGKRGMLAIGYSNMIKGLDKVEEVARVAGLRMLHLGTVDDGFFDNVPQCTSISGMEFTPQNIDWICKHYDFFFAMGRFDANPTSLLETSCWGLLAACTKESGYWPDEPFIELRLDDLAHNLDIVDWLQRAPSAELQARAEIICTRVIEQHSIEARLTKIWDKMLEFIA